MFDLKVLDLKDKLITDINESGLPASVLSYVIKDISDLVDKTLREQIQAQLNQRNQEQEQVIVDNVEEV